MAGLDRSVWDRGGRREASTLGRQPGGPFADGSLRWRGWRNVLHVQGVAVSFTETEHGFQRVLPFVSQTCRRVRVQPINFLYFKVEYVFYGDALKVGFSVFWPVQDLSL